MNTSDVEFIQMIVAETIRQLKKEGLLKNVTDTAYKDISDKLRRYYKNGETDPCMQKALAKLRDDPYFKILPLYFSYNYTIEELAEVFEVEISTISRNKKRLSLKIHSLLE